MSCRTLNRTRWLLQGRGGGGGRGGFGWGYTGGGGGGGERAGKAGTRVASYEKKQNVAERKDRRVTRQFFLTRTIPATTTECVWDGNGRGRGVLAREREEEYILS